MATRTTHTGEFLASFSGEGAVDDWALESGDGLIRYRQHRRGNRLPRKLGALQLEAERGLPARVVIIQAEFTPTCRERGLTFDLDDPASIAGFLVEYLLAVNLQAAAVRFEEERILAGCREVDPAFEADRHVMMYPLEVGQREVIDRASPLGFDGFMFESFPDLTAVHRVGQVPRDPCIPQ